jgi:hypothetical protein
VLDEAQAESKKFERPGRFQLEEARTEADAFHASAELAWTASDHARSYEVALFLPDRSGEQVAKRVVRGLSTRIDRLPPETKIGWRVFAKAWGGLGLCVGGGIFVTPKLKELPDVTFVSDMEWLRTTAGAGNTVHRDTNYSNQEIHIAGKTYPKGIWTHAFNDVTPADLTVSIANKGFATFVADAGVEDSAGQGSVQFQVLLDGVLKAESPVMRQGSVHRFEVDVSGAKEVTLRVLNGGDGYTCDHAAWGNARFIKSGLPCLLPGQNR